MGDTRSNTRGDTTAITPRLPAFTKSCGICNSVSCRNTEWVILIRMDRFLRAGTPSVHGLQPERTDRDGVCRKDAPVYAKRLLYRVHERHDRAPFVTFLPVVEYQTLDDGVFVNAQLPGCIAGSAALCVAIVQTADGIPASRNIRRAAGSFSFSTIFFLRRQNILCRQNPVDNY